jgi:hypothetical protein
MIVAGFSTYGRLLPVVIVIAVAESKAAASNTFFINIDKAPPKKFEFKYSLRFRICNLKAIAVYI